MEIKRDVYFERLINRKNNGFIKVITGIRRIGKSYLLNVLFYNHLLESGINKDNIIVFAFDSAEDLIKIGEDPLILDNKNPEKKLTLKNFLTTLIQKSKIMKCTIFYLMKFRT